MNPEITIEAVAHIIQVAVAPVFLLAGIAGFLNVLTSRLARIVDRARIIERQVNVIHSDKKELVLQEVDALWRRIRLINLAIRFCVMSALMVCVVIVTLFIGDIIAANLSKMIASMFITAMLMIIVGLVLFLLEVGTSTKRMKMGLEMTAPFEERP